MLTYDGVFFISIATILAGSFGLSVRYCLKSKCEKFSICCGLLEINRRVDLEVQEELAMMEMGNVEEENKDNKGRTNSPVPKLNLPKKHIQEKNNLEIKDDI